MNWGALKGVFVSSKVLALKKYGILGRDVEAVKFLMHSLPAPLKFYASEFASSPLEFFASTFSYG